MAAIDDEGLKLTGDLVGIALEFVTTCILAPSIDAADEESGEVAREARIARGLFTRLGWLDGPAREAVLDADELAVARRAAIAAPGAAADEVQDATHATVDDGASLDIADALEEMSAAERLLDAIGWRMRGGAQAVGARLPFEGAIGAVRGGARAVRALGPPLLPTAAAGSPRIRIAAPIRHRGHVWGAIFGEARAGTPLMADAEAGRSALADLLGATAALTDLYEVGSPREA